eukprot:symbB.v1.2.027152.t1/scaffold2767.1/size71155/1
MLSLPLVNRCSAIPRVPCIVPRRRWHFSGPRPAVAAAVVVTELARASGRGRLRRQARPMAWEVATKLVDAVNELRYSYPQEDLLDLLNSLDESLPTKNGVEATKLEIVPGKFVPPAGSQRLFLYDSEGRPSAGAPLVPCDAWKDASPQQKQEIMEDALTQLKLNGFVVLEKLFAPEKLQALLEDFRHQRSSGMPQGVTFSRMRAERDMTIPPFNKTWADDEIICHPLILALLARYLRNSTNMSEEKSAEMSFAHWLGGGGDIEAFTSGRLSAGYPELDLLVVVDTPAGAPAQTQHRDTILPGPCASLGVHIPLTAMQADPLNGAIGFFPGSHLLRGDLSGRKAEEMVGASAPGSVILYDSFTEHRGLENQSSEPRAALFAWFRVPGVYTGHTEENFGPEGLERGNEFRHYVRPRLQRVEREQRLLSKGDGDEDAWGFRRGARLIPWTRSWGEERVCFCCNQTALSGVSAASSRSSMRKEWYCQSCWEKCDGNPMPWPGNLTEPFEQADHISEERLCELQKQGLNITPGQGRHKLTLLRERGYFLPVDPSNSWLDRVSNDPQPSGWKDAMRKALGEEHGPFASRQLVRLHSLQGAAELNGRLGRLGNFDPTAERWQVDLRPMGEKGERKMLKEGNLQSPQKPEIPALLSVAELKERGNEHVKKWEYEEAIAFYSKAVELLEDPEISKPPDVMDPKYFAVVLNNRAQCYMNLFRELHGQEGKCGEARSFAMRANLDSAKSIELDPSNGKAYYRRGCAMLGMAPSASRAKEAIWHLEAAFAGRASGGKDGVVLPNAMRHEVSTVLDYAKKRLDDCTEAAVPDVDQCRENCRQQ